MMQRTLTPPLFTTGITKLGKWVNDLNNQSDSDSNDQAFAINFTSNMPDFERIKWSFTETDSLCITDLRGNKLQTVQEEITLETVPPFILDTRAVVGSPKMYVKFNENITNAIGEAIEPHDFTIIGSSLTLESIESHIIMILLIRKNIYSFNSPLTDDLIASELFHANPNAIRDSLRKLHA